MDDLTRDVRQLPGEAQRSKETSSDERHAPEKPSRWKRVLGFGIGGVVLIGLAIGGTMYWLNARHFESTDDAMIDAYSTQMAPRVAGQVTKLLFSDNQHVSAGQTLLLIDPRDYQARLDQARAQQAGAEASLQQAQAQIIVQQ